MVSHACVETEERAAHLRDELQQHGVITQTKTDIDGSIWLRFSHERRVYDIVITHNHGKPHCMALTYVDELESQADSQRYHALERVNAANLHSMQGQLVLTPLGTVNASVAIDGYASATDILATINRLNVAIAAYQSAA